MTISWNDFSKIDMRVGEIIKVEDFPEARIPAYKVTIFLGDQFGNKVSSAQATNYSKEELMGMQVVCVVNFPPKQIANFFSEVLIIGVPDENNKVSILTPSRKAKIAGKVY